MDTLRFEGNFLGTETGFYTSRRINLDLPHNYFPGPGTYEIKRYLDGVTSHNNGKLQSNWN